MLEIDGSYGEGGGQLVRTAVALAAVTGREIVVRNIRVMRDKPGLAPQHLASVRAVATLCGAQVEGLELRSQALRFTPNALLGGEHRFDIGTAGCVSLVLQALLPAMIASGRAVAVTVTVAPTCVRHHQSTTSLASSCPCSHGWAWPPSWR
jgi:RNA 3'-terminal phosphate cyclase (ATP)